MLNELMASGPAALITGLLAFGMMAASFQSNVRQHILYLQIVGMLLLGIHFMFLGAWTGLSMMIVLIARNLLYAQRDRFAWADSPLVFYFSLLAVVGAGLLTWQGWGSFFAIAGAFTATYGFWQKDPKRIRIFLLISCLVWAPYGIIFKSLPLILLQLFIISSILVAMWRYDRSTD